MIPMSLYTCTLLDQKVVSLLIKKIIYKKVLQRFNLINAKSVPTPLPEGYQPQPNKGSPDPEIHTSYQQVIGSLLYTVS